MLKNVTLKPISGTFISPMLVDLGVNNYGLRQWEQDFTMMKAVGIDTVIVLRCEYECNGTWLSAEDPRSTTWPEDDCLLDMFFRLCDKYGIDLYLAGAQSMTNLFLGNWKQEIADTKAYYDRTVPKYAHHPCFKGLYHSLEALPWHYNFAEITVEIIRYFKKQFPQYKTLLSPIFFGPTGDMHSNYTPEQWREVFGRYLFEPMAGYLDACAPQDQIAAPACRLGEIQPNDLEMWYRTAKEVLNRCGIAFWANVETFQRPFVGHGEPAGVFRQADYRTLYMKLITASGIAEKIITCDFTTCLSPNSEWGSSRRLLERYLEMQNIPLARIDEVYGPACTPAMAHP